MPTFDAAGLAAAAFALLTWVVNHWADLGALLASLVAFYQAWRARKFEDLVKIAGELAYNIATLAELGDRAKRDLVAERLAHDAGPLARRLFTDADFQRAVETGWKLIAKPRMAAEAS